MKPLRIGMYGGGTVGGGVYELIMKNKASNIVISKICVRDLSKPRTFQIDESVTTLTADAEEMMKSDDIDCVVEGEMHNVTGECFVPQISAVVLTESSIIQK
jgi:predicted dehydrogenase